MIENKEQPDLIPAEEVQNCEAWQMPVLEAVGEPFSAAGKQKRRITRPEDPFAGPMTASKAQLIQDQAYKEGLELGRQAGLQQAQAEINQTKAQLNHLMGQMIHPLQEQQHELEQALVHLSSGMARALIKNMPQIDEKVMLEVARQALAELPDGSENIRLIVHPNDAEVLKDVAIQQGESWQVIADASLVSGGCMVKSQHSFVDFTLDTRFQLMLEGMMEQQLNGGSADSSEPV
ncbi:MAG: FliH/SctL family protein [Pseudomonadales bacterium]